MFGNNARLILWTKNNRKLNFLMMTFTNTITPIAGNIFVNLFIKVNYIMGIERQYKIMNYLVVVKIFFSLIFMVLGQMDSDSYGPYKIAWHNIESCKGPKQTDCGIFELKNKQNVSDILFLIDFPKDCAATAAKIIVSTHNKNTTKRLWNYVLNKPCQHFVLGPILVESFNLTNNCKINKGRYEVHLNFKEKSTMFLGSNFFYGIYTFKTMSYNKINNFFCVNAVIEVKKPS